MIETVKIHPTVRGSHCQGICGHDRS
jgi:hypothetical protein